MIYQVPINRLRKANTHACSTSSCHTKGCDSLSKGRYDETFAGEDGSTYTSKYLVCFLNPYLCKHCHVGQSIYEEFPRILLILFLN